MPRKVTLTRRKLLVRSAQVGAGLSISGLAAGVPARAAGATDQPPPDQPPLEAFSAPSGLPAPPLGDAEYWRFADWLAPYFDGLWVPEQGHYGSGNSTMGRIYHNSLLLTTHAIAALVDHDGPSRRDARARLLARRLCESPPWSELTEPKEPDPQFHTPGWVESLATRDAAMDKSIDAKVAEALTHAWRARDVLGLPEDTRTMIADRVSRCARGPFFRFPNVRLNQINWNCELYAYAATITGDTELLRNDYRLQVDRFCAGIKHPLKPGGSPNLGPGYRFHYLPAHPTTHPYNLDSAEYANETCHFIAFYEQALRAGMEPLPAARLRLLRAWIEHIVYAYWTHGGYLNWDTGYGFKRWHAGRTWAFAQQGLLAIAASPRFHASSQLGSWAKYFFDQGLRLYERLSREAADGRGIAPSNLYSIEVAPLGPSIREMFAARMQANAARAVAQGMGSMPASEPPALYSLDSDIGRLTVTTPTYSTAVLAVNQRAVPYGGTELARLYDSEQRVVANVGGRPPASFGVLVRNGSAKQILISQRARNLPPSQPPLELIESPRGRVTVAKRYPRRPYGGPFKTLVAKGHASSPQVSVETTHRFESAWVQTHWAVRRKVRGRFTVDVLFPSWGRGATIEAVLARGRRVTLAGPDLPRRRVSLDDVIYFYVAGEETGYVIVPVDRPRRAVAHALRPGTQSSSPRPGPTLALQLARQRRFQRVGLTARIAPAASKEQAARVYRRLRRLAR